MLTVHPISCEQTAAFMRKNDPHVMLHSVDFHIWQNANMHGAFWHDRLCAVGGMIDSRVSLSGKGSLPVAFGVNFVVESGDQANTYPTKQCAHAIVRHFESSPHYAGTGMTRKMVGYWRKRGHRIDESNAIFIRPIRPYRVLSYLASRPNCSHLNVSKLAAPFLFAANMIKPPREVTPADQFEFLYTPQPYDMDIAGSDSLLRYGCMTTRNTGMVVKKLSHPRNDYCLWVNRERNDSRAYVIFRDAQPDNSTLKIVKIVDFGGPKHLLPALLARVTKYAIDVRADAVICLTSKIDDGLMEEAGLYASRTYPVMLPKDLTSDVRVTFLDSDIDDLW